MRFRYWILAMMTSLLASCSSDAVLSAEGDEEETSDLVTEVSASCSGFTAGITRSDAETSKKTVKDTDPESEAYILGMKEFKEGDKIYILQKGPNLTPKFPGDFFDHRKDENYKMPNNIYLYEYSRKDDATWSDGYNFKVMSKCSDPISWSTVKSNGSIGNSFVFYAFCDNLKDLEPRGSEDLNPDWVGTGENLYYHHAYGGKWKKSDNVPAPYDYSNDWHAHHYQNHCGVPDFMGAYHTTSTLFSRPRFKFYHLLAYVRVTLYVPVVDTYRDKDPNNKDQEVERMTGYDETAFVLSNEGENLNYGAGVWIGNNTSGQRTARTRFTIDWNANRSSDKDAPLTQVLTNATTPGFQFAYCMYRHNPLDVTDIRYKPETAAKDFADIQEGIGIIDRFDVTEFVVSSANARKYLTSTDGKYYDKVRRYEFSAAMPAQTISSSILMQIHMRVPGTGVDGIRNGGTTSSSGPYNNYAKYTLSASNLFAGKNDLAFKQNTITHLRIYLPRAADEAILVNAEVLPWENTHTDMAVSPDDWGD